MHLADVVPDTDVLIALEPEELGLRILQVLAGWSGQLIQIELRAFLNGVLQGFHTPHVVTTFCRLLGRLGRGLKVRACCLTIHGTCAVRFASQPEGAAFSKRPEGAPCFNGAQATKGRFASKYPR